MSLTLGTGPLAGSPGGAFNFALDGAPKHRIYFADHPVRIRAVVAGRTILDTTRAKLLHESNIPPVTYVPLEDLDAGLLERTEHRTHCPFKGDASYWTLRIGERVERDFVWAYEAPLPEAAWLEGHAALYWDRVDEVFVEDERAFGRMRDPFHRVDVYETSRPVRLTVGGTTLAQTTRAKLLVETGLPSRPYLPRADLPAGALVASEKRTICPYKGEATYWHLDLPDGGRIEDAAWSYETPLPEALKAQGHVAFDGEAIAVEVSAPG
jgi:uncharacterized protein (DUF427 family)